MTDHPSTFRGDSPDLAEFDWQDGASIHLKDQAEGVLHGMGAIHSGTFAQMVAMISQMPEDRRDGYVIQKAGDRLFGPAEISELAARPDFPG